MFNTNVCIIVLLAKLATKYNKSNLTKVILEKCVQMSNLRPSEGTSQRQRAKCLGPFSIKRQYVKFLNIKSSANALTTTRSES